MTCSSAPDAPVATVPFHRARVWRRLGQQWLIGHDVEVHPGFTCFARVQDVDASVGVLVPGVRLTRAGTRPRPARSEV